MKPEKPKITVSSFSSFLSSPDSVGVLIVLVPLVSVGIYCGVQMTRLTFKKLAKWWNSEQEEF